MNICLKLIICNIDDDIERLIISIKYIINSYIIIDNITNHEYIYLLKDIPGIICNTKDDIYKYDNILSIDYYLILESNMIIDINNFDNNILYNADAFYITEIKDNIEIQNIRLFKNRTYNIYQIELYKILSIPPENIIITYNNKLINKKIMHIIHNIEDNTINENINNLYNLIIYYKNNNKYNIACICYKILEFLIQNNNISCDELCKYYYEYSLIAYYNNIYNINNEIIYILNNSKDNNINLNLLNNIKHYKFILNYKKLVDLSDTININFNNEYIKLYSSSASYIKYNNNNIINVRYVNYYINEQGTYLYSDKYIVSFNKYLKLDDNFKIIDCKFFDTMYINKMYIGIEDIRLYNDNNQLIFIGCEYNNNKIEVVNGIYNIDNNILKSNRLITTFSNNNCEKNWIYFNYNNVTHIIYSWYPLKICNINNNVINIVKLINMPFIFSYAKGSTCGFLYNNIEHWFIVHITSNEIPRYYYNIICIFDLNMNLLKYSAPFKIEEHPIEFCLSITIINNDVIIPYSTWDRTTKIAIYDKLYIDNILIYTSTTITS